ncbi:hypothetical protein H4R20_005461 [Coemansia guatemalensis]|uniref:Uncharacterized protein n=1 Tax=Coemansia guatemalensis TaxID=2761395 RepID=A0A9W8LS43_9FUNG|nr:hypothetical protein H4R20_005461 [Coemansia guatemalensis]
MNNNPRNLPDELLSPNRPPRRSTAPVSHSEPGTPRPRDHGATDQRFGNAARDAPGTQLFNSADDPQVDNAFDRRRMTPRRRQLDQFRERLGLARPTGVENPPTFVTASQMPGNPAQGHATMRLDKRVASGAEIRGYPSPLPPTSGSAPLSPRHPGQVTRVAPHGLYAALTPVLGSRTAEGYGDAYFHGTPSYAHLEEVPGTYPRSAFRHQNEMNYEYVHAGYARPATVRSTETRLDNRRVDFAHPLPERTEYEQWNDDRDGCRHYHPHGQTAEDVRGTCARPPTQRQYPDGYGEEDDGGYVWASRGRPYQEATHDPRRSYDEEARSQRARPPQEL